MTSIAQTLGGLSEGCLKAWGGPRGVEWQANAFLELLCHRHLHMALDLQWADEKLYCIHDLSPLFSIIFSLL